ncbi:aminotransferase class III-fold pyridoxal phosphate-dependent enzyme [bacterium]|nr:aminotransferase class III-fold pyridoxal phosphate-dependent enzyme [bacterium]
MNNLLLTEFGLQQVEIKKLNGYDNVNYLVKSNAEKSIFKTYTSDANLQDLIESETDVLRVLNKEGSNLFPKPISFTDGSFVKTLDLNGQEQICRMLSFLDGDFLGDVEHTKELFQSLGFFLAKMDLELQKITDYTIQARQWEWDIQYLDLNKKYINDISDARDRNTVKYFFMQFEEIVRPALPHLRKQVIHNDANEWNVLTKNGEVSGIIDFGDLAHSPLINELAIAITYACFEKENPLEWASIILKSYHSQLPLKENEISVLYYLIAARLVTSICNSAHSQKANPENTYASVSENSAWKMLYKWLSINPIHAENIFRKAIDLPNSTSDSIEDVIERRQTHISEILSLSYKKPIYMDRSAFQYMYDNYGNTYLDAYNNIPHVGHSHPKIVEAGQRQMAKLNTNTRYLYDQLAEYAKKLLNKFPSKLNKVYFVNSGSAASDLAIRMAKIHTGSEKLMVMEHGYHGHTQVATDISDYKFNHPKGQGQKNYILKTNIPDTYRGQYTNENAGKLYAKEAIKQINNSEDTISAFISEPIVGCGGQVPLANGYLKDLYPAIRKQGGICISDEVQTGFGRLGDYFWGFEAHNVIPDMVIIGKPMANGHPMGAVVCTDEIAESFGKGVEFFSSFGGNPVSCSIASAVLDVIEEENLQENAKNVGDYYKSLLLDLQKEYDCIGDVRGSGLFLGMEIIKGDNIEPDTNLASHIKNELRNQHILISTDGPFDSVIKTKPAMCFTKENARTVVESIDLILKSYYNRVS